MKLRGININKATAKPSKYRYKWALNKRREQSPVYQAEQERIRKIVEEAKEDKE